jgi:hypothetical protein
MKSNNKSKNKINNNIEDEESAEDSPSINLNTKKNFSASNKHNIKINSNNSNLNTNNNNNNSNNQVNPFKKNKKKRDKKKENHQNNNSNSNSNNNFQSNQNFNNNIKHLNNNNNYNINNSSSQLFNMNKKEPSNQQKLEDANYQMQQMNFEIAEKQYKLIYENCSNYSNQFLMNLLNNYSICLYNQRKFEESAEIATKIILEYDNKNKRAYLTLLSILYSIKEYKKAVELIDKINTIFKKPKDFEIFRSVINDINNAINEEEDNKQRDIYYIREKKIIDLVHNKWIHFGLYSLGTFIGGCMLYKFISK